MREELFQIIVGLAAFFGGLILKRIIDDVKQLTLDLSNMKVLVAGDYVKKSEFEAKIDALFHKLDSIDSKLDYKVSKEDCAS